MFRRGLANLLRGEDEFEVVGEATDGREALEMARQLAPDVVLIDIAMPDMNGLEATRRIRAENPDVRIVVLTGSCSHRTRDVALANGANHYLLKNVALSYLYDALRGH